MSKPSFKSPNEGLRFVHHMLYSFSGPDLLLLSATKGLVFRCWPGSSVFAGSSPTWEAWAEGYPLSNMAPDMGSLQAENYLPRCHVSGRKGKGSSDFSFPPPGSLRKVPGAHFHELEVGSPVARRRRRRATRTRTGIAGKEHSSGRSGEVGVSFRLEKIPKENESILGSPSKCDPKRFAGELLDVPNFEVPSWKNVCSCSCRGRGRFFLAANLLWEFHRVPEVGFGISVKKIAFAGFSGSESRAGGFFWDVSLLWRGP